MPQVYLRIAPKVATDIFMGGYFYAKPKTHPPPHKPIALEHEGQGWPADHIDRNDQTKPFTSTHQLAVREWAQSQKRIPQPMQSPKNSAINVPHMPHLPQRDAWTNSYLK
jgi:hypothetical protein